MQAASHVRTSNTSQGTPKNSSSLGLLKLDSTYANNLRTNGEKLLLPPNEVPTGVELWSCRGDDLLQWLTDRNKSDARIEYIDVREPKEVQAMPAPWQRQFRGAKHIQIDNPNNVTSKFKAWRESNAKAFDELLQADYVIIHCQNGSERSPLLVKEYAEAWKNDTRNKMKNLHQKICLLRKGFDAGWIKEEDWRNKGDSLNGQKKYGVTDPFAV